MSIGINLRVTGHTSIGGRKYQEDYFSVAYQQTENDQSLEYAFFGIYDGHGGAEASFFAKEHLMNTIVSQKLFWSDNDDDVLKAIREGYIQTHYAMWREQDKWPKTSSGLPSTAGTTASVAFIRQGKIYVGHVGDSGIVLGYQKDKEKGDDPSKWAATPLTEDHKPESYAEKMRIMNCGGKVVSKSGVPRVVWNRPRIGHKGPVRRSTPIDEIPFLAVARSLGDLWSYNSAVNEFVVNEALERWSRSNMKADNTSVVIIMLDPPGPPKRDVLRSMRASIQHIDYQPTNTHPMHNMNVTLFDHTTRELIDLSQVTCQEAPPISQDDTLHQPYLEPHASTSYQDMGYSNSFADSYNTYLNSSLNNDHSYTSHTTTTEQYSVNHSSQQHNSSQAHGLIYQDESIKTSEQDTDDTYSLTNLQTKSERLHSQMLEASTTASTSRYQNTGNVAIIENFHDYPMPHMPTNQPYDNQFHHQTFQQDQPSYQMERFDYNHHQNDQNECNFSSSHYTAHDLSEQNYQREHEEYLYHEESSVNVSSETNTMIVHQPSILNPCLVESSKTEETNTTVDSLSSDSVERRCVDRVDEEDIQINEISSSNLNVLSPVQEAINHSDSDSCASGDESKASSSTSRAVINSNQVCSKKNSPAVSKTRSSTIKKSIKKIVRIVYETRSSDRPHRTRSRQESLKLKSGRTINNRLKKFFNKNSQVKGFLEYRRVKHVTDYRLTDNNNCAIKSNNNNVSAAATSKDSETNTGKRILRSSEGKQTASKDTKSCRYKFAESQVSVLFTSREHEEADKAQTSYTKSNPSSEKS
ncbi:phosphatase 2c [Culex quinquefasciatus]|uniref:Phosphatase 2c n=1 Tax=Culex quinquefasciatus TaxID=7176 RepID=B0X9R8_CULQU|nr:phosphatase 2c [Culex quinquefasciatus]|eukprot:XP_001866390.1 phosphatase 2c [Culex quinquefasciatus]